jgi:hypothetical protein
MIIQITCVKQQETKVWKKLKSLLMVIAQKVLTMPWCVK